jgi:hypothetical protein
MYFNSTVNNTRFYNGTAWEDPEATATSGASTATTKANEAAASASAALTSKNSAAADLVLTNADVVLTHADVVLTHADVVLTTADLALTNADVVLTHADVANTADKLPKSGGTMTGTLILSGNPSAGNHASNKTYVDSAIIANNATIPDAVAMSIALG